MSKKDEKDGWELYEVNDDKPLFARAKAMTKAMVEYDAEMDKAKVDSRPRDPLNMPNNSLDKVC